MPGVYLAAILVSAAGVAALDVRFRLVVRRAPGRAAAAVAIGTAFFVVWDLVGIAAGVFVKGASPLYVGVDLAPHLPLEEPVFLAFLCYLALVVHAAALRWRRGAPRGATESGWMAQEPTESASDTTPAPPRRLSSPPGGDTP